MKRTFIAIKIPVSDKLKKILKILRTGLKEDNIKWVDTENLHITLSFIGDTSEEDVDNITKKLGEIASEHKATNLHFKEIGVFRNIRKPRVLWVGMERNEILEKLQSDIELMLSGLGIRRDNKSFKPHLTIARIKWINDINVLKEYLQKYKGETIQKTKIEKIIYYESKLTANGPIYNSIKKFPLEKTC